MAAISQTTFSNAYSWMKFFFYFNSNFSEIYSQGSDYQYASIGDRRQAIFWTKHAKGGLVYWRMYMLHSASMH